jgi:hypothetical protein
MPSALIAKSLSPPPTKSRAKRAGFCQLLLMGRAQLSLQIRAVVAAVVTAGRLTAYPFVVVVLMTTFATPPAFVWVYCHRQASGFICLHYRSSLFKPAETGDERI